MKAKEIGFHVDDDRKKNTKREFNRNHLQNLNFKVNKIDRPVTAGNAEKLRRRSSSSPKSVVS